MEISKIKINHEIKKSFLNLINNTLNINQTKEWFDWKFHNNPYDSNSLIFGAVENNNIIGMQPYMPYLVSDGKGNKIKAAKACHTAVNKNYRRQGIFSNSLKVSYEYFKKNGYKLLFVYPNNNSLPGYLKMGWKDIGVIDGHFYFNSLSRILYKKFDNVFLKYITIPFDLIIDSLTDNKFNYKDLLIKNKFINKNDVVNFNNNIYKIYKDSSYFKWRFIQVPQQNYEFITIYRNNKLNGYAVITTKIIDNVKHGIIVDYNYINKNIFEIILKHSILKLKSLNCALFKIVFTKDSSVINNILKKYLFFSRKNFPIKYFNPARRMLIKVIDENYFEEDIFKIKNWELKECDQDLI